uniref:Uncharacterized protein n=1 Tax=Arundo donax TaxID=35708 RepID=A0A0A9EPR1_ARUDO
MQGDSLFSSSPRLFPCQDSTRRCSAMAVIPFCLVVVIRPES